MATNPYEVEHNIKASTARQHSRRPDMSTFTSHLNSISQDPSTTTSSSQQHLGPNPVDMAGLFQFVQDQFATLATTAPNEENRHLLSSLIRDLENDVDSPPDHIPGVSQEYLDTLDRVPKKKLQADTEGSCPICAEKYLDDPYPLVVELPCGGHHTFDLECVAPWLQSKGTCPMCRHDLTKKKAVEIPQDEEEDEDVDGLYG
ncbi:hypothetical protein F5Y16DRAFT_390559 [Xylariaceae sp. FL0255]|nr:hypothetical protein F5Y16DRAFT_390559 [Xylariaceae sp. FL0255]